MPEAFDPRTRRLIADSLAKAKEQAEGGDVPGAVAHLERALTLDPEHLLVRKRLGRLLAAEGDHDRAVELWSGLVEEAPEEAHTRLARIHEARGDREAAIRHWQALLELPGEHAEAEARKRLGRLLVALGDADRAAAIWTPLVDEEPLEAHLQLARLHEAGGQKSLAIRHWEALLELRDDHPEARTRLARLRKPPRRSGQMPQMLNLMILGARRCATTSLGYYLMEHPEIYHVTYKDFDAVGGLKVNYPYNIPFAYLAGRDAVLDTYRDVTPDRPPGKDPERLLYILNRAVYAIYHPHMLFNLAEHLPDLRILLSLRSPVDSLFSAYCKMLQEGRTSGSFEEAFLGETRLDEPPPTGMEMRDLDGRTLRSIYYPGIEMIFRLFPREQVHVVSFPDLTRRTAETMRGVCRFLGIDEEYDFTRLEVVRGQTEKPAPMLPETRRWLEELFAPHDRRLFKLLGWPEDAWEAGVG